MTLVEAYYASRNPTSRSARHGGRLPAWLQARATDLAMLAVLCGLWGGAFAVRLGWLAA